MKVVWKVQRSAAGTGRRTIAYGCRVLVIEDTRRYSRAPWIYVSALHADQGRGVIEEGLCDDVAAGKRRALKLARRIARRVAR